MSLLPTLSRTCLFLSKLLLAATLPAMAATIDQQNTASTGSVSASTGFGQSFTPSLNGIDFVSFVFVGANGSVYVELYEGAGFGGSVLGSTASQEVTVAGEYEFLFGSVIPLTPGDVYTLRLWSSTGYLSLREGSGDPYSGGSEYNSLGDPEPTYDLVFKEGLTDSEPVPEPGTMVLGACGLVLLALQRRKK